MTRSFQLAAVAAIAIAVSTAAPALAQRSIDDAIKTIDSFRANGDTPALAPLSFVPPPRTITDITAILDQQKPDPAQAAAARAAAVAEPPIGISQEKLATFYFERGTAAGVIGRLVQRRDDMRQAVRIAHDVEGELFHKNLLLRFAQPLAGAEMEAGNMREALAAFQERLHATPSSNTQATAFAMIEIAATYARLGDLEEANRWLSRAEGQPLNPRSHPAFGDLRAARIAGVRALVFEAQGKYGAAEGLYRQAIERFEKRVIPNGAALISQSVVASEPWTYALARIRFVQSLARTLLRQGRLAEAETEARRALLDVLTERGHYASETAGGVLMLATVIYEEGRYAEAQRLAQAARDIYQNVGHGSGSYSLADARRWVAQTETAQGKIADARAEYATLEKDIGDDADLRRRFLEANLDYALVLLRSGQAREVVRIIENVVAQNRKSLGDKDFVTAQTRGWLAVALARTGQNARALEEFEAAMPILLAASREETGDDDGSSVGQRDRQTQVIVESYLGLLADEKGSAAASETFHLAEATRGQSVQRALTASSARATASDPALSNLARHEQDAQRQAAALQGVLANILTQPTSEQGSGAVQTLRAQIDQLRTARARIREEIERRFPGYANLVDPKPATVEQAQQSLKPGEALIASYVGEDRLFVWAVPQQGSAVFASRKVSAAEIEALVAGLHRSLDPNTSSVEGIPAFDVAKAHRLYELSLGSVQAGWAGAQSLLIVPHKALASLPIGLLVTDAVPQPAKGGLPFAEYKSVPFLVRRVAVTQLPSVASLAALRALPAPRNDRLALAAFGDPWFSPEQAAEARSGRPPVVQSRSQPGAIQTRGIPLVRRNVPRTDTVDSAELGMLPRLPDTADEVRNVALALHADVADTVFLGAAANERSVKTMDLAKRKIVMFATHGLVPGDLNGLTQPALALSAPLVANVDGDGLLTMEEVLALKLDADWVVLSACNTASGAGADGEAVSGLGRAFFYAGTRALLVSNWPVETVSARILISDLFRRQADNPSLARAEAVRQAELALIDGPGAVDTVTKKPLFSYAHPIFWAPFSVVGDGG